MVGTVLMFDSDTNEGRILGEDKVIYDFHIGEWLSNQIIKIGLKVIYDVEEDEARNIELYKNKSTIYLKIDIRRDEEV